MRFGVVLVHYHTPELARTALEALHRDEAASGVALDLVLLDNGSTEAERRSLAALDVRVIDAGGNLGYAGGFNRGAAELRGVDALVVMNPDVRVLPGCFAALEAALEDGAGVAGPRFWWHRAGGFLLPPTEERGRVHGLRRFLAPRLGAAPARRAWRDHARRHWLAEEPLPSHALSGALLAIDSDAWRHVGPFDDGYRLYFEETDWLERARRAGVPGFYVPAAEALHAYAQSTASEPRSAQWFAESHRRFRRRHYGRLFAGAIERAARAWPERPEKAPEASARRLELEAAEWLEIASSSLGFPAAGLRVEGPVSLPALPGGAFWLRGVRGEEELFCKRLA